MTGPVFLDVEDVEGLHEDQIRLHGGSAGVRDRAGLESSVAAPQASFGGEFLHGDLFEMSAAYAFHIAMAHPFVDGNKRTGLHAALVFLKLNGILVKDPAGKLVQAMVGIAERKLDKPGLATLLRKLAGS